MDERVAYSAIKPGRFGLMIGARSDVAVRQGMADPASEWFAWERMRKDESWLVSFVDLLIILLASLVVLIGQMVAPPPLPMETETRGDRLARLVQERFQGEISASLSGQGVVLEISDAILFDSSRATLRTSASPVLTRLAATLQETGDALVAIEGHTDDRPVQRGEFRSNWELASARAYAVTDFLIVQGLAAGRLRAVSYADTRPAADNATPEGRAANRRVELRVEFAEDTDELILVNL